MKDLENLTKALNELSQAINASDNELGVDQNEFWMRAASIVLDKLQHRTCRLANEEGEYYAFTVPLLTGLGAFADAKRAFERKFALYVGEDLDEDLSDIKLYLSLMKGSNIALLDLLREPFSHLSDKYPLSFATIKELESALEDLK